MKTTYLINKIQPDGSVRLCVASSAEWMAIVKGNKKIPTEQRRYFILDYIADGDNLDCMVIETSLEEYRSWDRSRSAEKRNRCAKQKFQHLSLNTPLNDSENSETLLDMISADEQVESMVCDSIMIDELKKNAGGLEALGKRHARNVFKRSKTGLHGYSCPKVWCLIPDNSQVQTSVREIYKNFLERCFVLTSDLSSKRGEGINSLVYFEN